ASWSAGRAASKLPGRMRAACSGRCSGDGFSFRRFSTARLARAERSPPPSLPTTSSSVTSSPHATRWAATCAPMVPPPRTTAFLKSLFTRLLVAAGRGAVGRRGRSGGRALVQAIDDVLVLLLHHPALHLQRRRQLPRLQRELVGQEGDLRD